MCGMAVVISSIWDWTFARPVCVELACDFLLSSPLTILFCFQFYIYMNVLQILYIVVVIKQLEAPA